MIRMTLWSYTTLTDSAKLGASLTAGRGGPETAATTIQHGLSSISDCVGPVPPWNEGDLPPGGSRSLARFECLDRPGALRLHDELSD
jgi:hypothetical protein